MNTQNYACVYSVIMIAVIILVGVLFKQSGILTFSVAGVSCFCDQSQACAARGDEASIAYTQFCFLAICFLLLLLDGIRRVSSSAHHHRCGV